MSSRIGRFGPKAVLQLFMLSLVGRTVAIISANRDNSSDCFLRGFPGSTLNKCGYCVGGQTGLSFDYGLDCAGTCGLAFTDCSGTCNGQSYQDECTRECIGGNASFNEEKMASKRDCRGLCRLDNITTSAEHEFEYVTDECSMCIRRRSGAEGVHVTQVTITNGTSPSTNGTNTMNTSVPTTQDSNLTIESAFPTTTTTPTTNMTANETEHLTETNKRDAPSGPNSPTNATSTNSTKVTPKPKQELTETASNMTSNETEEHAAKNTSTTLGTEPQNTTQTLPATPQLEATTNQTLPTTSETEPELESATGSPLPPTTNTTTPSANRTISATNTTTPSKNHTISATNTTTPGKNHTNSAANSTTPATGKNITSSATNVTKAGEGEERTMTNMSTKMPTMTSEKSQEPGKSNTTNVSSNALYTDNYKSVYMDCTGTCYTPATFGQMSVMSNETCNQCLATNASRVGTVRNECGRCLSDSEPCLCAMARQDVCGVCDGQNNTCTTILSAYPTIIPSDTATTVNAVGVALKSKYHAVCLLIRRDIDKDGRDEWKFPADVSGTSISCSVTAPEGIYKLHLGVALENNEILNYSQTSLPFLVYSKSAAIHSMAPKTAIIPKPSNESLRLLIAFDAQELQRIDTMHCTIYGDGYAEPIVVTSVHVTDKSVSCVVPFPTRSSTANVNVSLDLGPRGSLAGPFPITFYASAPSVTRFVPLPEGDRLAIFFDLDVAATNGSSTNCSRMFASKSLETLGANSTCVWVTKRQLMVAFEPLKPAVINPNALSSVPPKIVLYFNDKAIYADNENYTQSAANMSIAFQLADEPPLAILSGPSNVVPLCGDFVLDGHQSAGLQSRRAHYVWSVAFNSSSENSSMADANSTDPKLTTYDDDGNATTATTTAVVAKDNLTKLLKDATTANLAYVVIEASDMEFDVEYAFSLTVSNGITSTSPPSTATLTIVRSRLPLPALFIEPSIIQYRDRVSVDSRFTLTANIDMPMCLRELYSIHFRWSTSNPRVKFDVLQMNSTSYIVEPYTLPPNENVTFEVKVWLNNDLTLLSAASVSFTVDRPAVKAILSGGKRRSVGIDSGLLQLNASASYHTTMPSIPLVYRWECLTEDGNPCYNYDPSLSETQLVAKPIDREGVLSVRTDRLRAGNRMTFKVRAFSPMNASQMSAAQTTIVQVTNNSAPLVTIEHIVSKMRLGGNKPEVDDNMVYQVTSDANVEVVATVLSTSGLISDINWEIPGFASDFNPYKLREDVSNEEGNWTVRSSLVIRKDFLVANGMYEINVTATNEWGESGWSSAEFVVNSPISNCRVTVPAYEAFTMSYVYVDGCMASHLSYPLRYQAFVYYRGSPMSITASELSLPMSIMGPPAMPSSSIRVGGRKECPANDDNANGENIEVQSLNDSNIFAVEVCDVFSNCWMFNSSRTDVKPARDIQAAATHVFAMANIAKLTDNYLTCLRRHAFYLMEASVNPSYLADNDLEFQSQLAQAYVCARKAAEEQCNDADCFANLFTFLTTIPIDTRTSREFMLNEVLERALHRIETRNVTLNAIGVQEAFIVLEAVYRFNESDVTAAQIAADMESRFQSILARSLAIGDSPVVLDMHGHPLVAMSYHALNSTMEVLTNATTNSTVTVHFGSEFNSKYDAWKCVEGGPICRGVVAELQFYPDHVFQPISIDDRPNRTVSEVIKATLLNPVTGDAVEDTSGTVMLTVPVDRLRMSEDLEYECHFWNVDDEKWSRNGMKTSDAGGKTLDCESDHLATFVVIGSEPRLSAWVIAVIVVSCVVVLLLVAGGGFYYYRKSRTQTMRVSMSRGYHANGQ